MEFDDRDTFRAFREHKQCHPLHDPGNADLTADVDFSYLRSLTQEKSIVFGPVNQRDFLVQIGIGLRLKVCVHDVVSCLMMDDLLFFIRNCWRTRKMKKQRRISSQVWIRSSMKWVKGSNSCHYSLNATEKSLKIIPQLDSNRNLFKSKA